MWVDDGHGCVERIPDWDDFNAPRVWHNPDPTKPPRGQTQRRCDVSRHDPATYVSPYGESWPYSYNPYFGVISARFA